MKKHNDIKYLKTLTKHTKILDKRNKEKHMIDLFDTGMSEKKPIKILDYPPIVSKEEENAIKKLYESNPELNNVPAKTNFLKGNGIKHGFDKTEAWIQTYSGRRFNPTKPNPDAIVIQDIAHSLSMQCRFTGHCREFYSVAQHSVLVSYICDNKDALWGLMHDASEAYLIDVPRPLKRSGKFQAYIDFETEMMKAICERFRLEVEEPKSVKHADSVLLATEARDLMGPLHPDWINTNEPLPFKIDAWDNKKSKDMFMKRFFELTDSPNGYEHYLKYNSFT